MAYEYIMQHVACTLLYPCRVHIEQVPYSSFGISHLPGKRQTSRREEEVCNTRMIELDIVYVTLCCMFHSQSNTTYFCSTYPVKIDQIVHVYRSCVMCMMSLHISIICNELMMPLCMYNVSETDDVINLKSETAHQNMHKLLL